MNLQLRTEADVATAARRARELAERAGMTPADAVGVATAVSEIATNVLVHAGGHGEVELAGDGTGVRVVVRDRGPGIANLGLALTDGFSTRGGLGLGLPGARRLMDEFAVRARAGGGTEIRMVKHVALEATPRVAEWTVSPAEDAAGFVVPFRTGFVACAATARGPARAAGRTVERAVELVHEDPGQSPVVLAERVRRAASPGTTPLLALAAFNALDGRLVWLVGDGASAVLLPVRGVQRRAPVLRAETLPLSRGDRLVLVAGAEVAVRLLRGKEDVRPRSAAQ